VRDAQAGGDYLVIVEENQATLLRAITTLFASRADAALRAASLPAWDMRAATTVDKGHGRVEVRHLIASTALNGYLDWPGLAQVIMIERVWWGRGARHEAARYAVTSLPADVAGAPHLLALVRGHRQIANGLHYVNGRPLGRVTLGEDRSAIHQGNGPSIMAILRDTVVSLLHRAGWRTIAARLRFYSGDAPAALALLGIPIRENALALWSAGPGHVASRINLTRAGSWPHEYFLPRQAARVPLVRPRSAAAVPPD
jgi:hypothetical protein